MKTRVLLITTLSAALPHKQQQNLHDFAVALHASDSDIALTYATVQDLVFVINAQNQPSIRLFGKELFTLCDVLLLRNVHKFIDYAHALRLYTDAHNIKVINASTALSPFYGKVSQGFLFAYNGIPTPALLSSPSNATLIKELEQTPYQYPYIIKHNRGIKGLDNYLVHSLTEAQRVLGQTKQQFLSQPYISNEGELRILTFGQQQPPVIFKKTASKSSGSHLNNTSQGGTAVPVSIETVSTEILKAAQTIMTLMERDITGIDVLLGTSGQWYVLEANLTPALGSGAFLSTKATAFTEYVKGTVL